MGKLIVLGGPSGVGKTSILKSMGEAKFRPLVTCTTRAPRPNEVDGVHYDFISLDEWHLRVSQGRMLERDEYAGNFYGIPKEKLDAIIEAPDDVVYKTVLTRVGLDFVRDYLGEQRVFGAYVYATKDVVEARLRLDPDRSPEQIAARLANADRMREFVLPEDDGALSREESCPASAYNVVVHNPDNGAIANVTKEILQEFAKAMFPKSKVDDVLYALIASINDIHCDI